MTTTTEELKSTLETPESISLQEIGFMFQIIQACAQRGAFKPEEFKDIGTLNQKLKSILNYAKELEDAAKDAAKDTAKESEAAKNKTDEAPSTQIKDAGVQQTTEPKT